MQDFHRRSLSRCEAGRGDIVTVLGNIVGGNGWFFFLWLPAMFLAAGLLVYVWQALSKS
jgi:hypothetical protein